MIICHIIIWVIFKSVNNITQLYDTNFDEVFNKSIKDRNNPIVISWVLNCLGMVIDRPLIILNYNT